MTDAKNNNASVSHEDSSCGPGFKSPWDRSAALRDLSTEGVACTDTRGSDKQVQSRAVLLKLINSNEFLSGLSKNQLQDLVTVFSQERKKRFRRRKDKKYGNINKGFTEPELQLFLKNCRSAKARLALRCMAYLGLRVSEVVRVRVEDIDFKNRKLRVDTLKASTGDLLYLHDEVFDLLRAWASERGHDIVAHDGYIFYSDNKYSGRQYISPHWLRNEFRDTAKLAGLDAWYSKSEESMDTRPARHLHRLTTHSLRHYFITRVYKETKDRVVAQKLARHTDSKSTDTYIYTAQQDLDVSMARTFEKGLIEKQKEEDEVKKLMAIWRAIK